LNFLELHFSMARPFTIEFPGAVYHVTPRDNTQAAVFVDDIGGSTLLSILRQTFRRFNALCHYCLMSVVKGGKSAFDLSTTKPAAKP